MDHLENDLKEIKKSIDWQITLLTNFFTNDTNPY